MLLVFAIYMPSMTELGSPVLTFIVVTYTHLLYGLLAAAFYLLSLQFFSALRSGRVLFTEGISII